MNRTAKWNGTVLLEKGTVMTPETHSRYLIKAMLSFGYADLVPKRKKKQAEPEKVEPETQDEPEMKEADNG